MNDKSNTPAVRNDAFVAFEGRINAIAKKSASAMAAHLTPDRLARVVLSEARRNPKLTECDTTSLGVCIALCAQLGLEPTGPLGHAYLIPRWSKKIGGQECTIIVGYKGYAELARRTGQIKRMDARVVYEADDFEVTFGPEGTFRHRPLATEDGRIDAKITHAYSWIETKDGGIYLEVLDRVDIEKRRKRGASGQGHSTPWDTDYAAMARKSALRALFAGGLVPMSAELVSAIEHERQDETVLDAEDVRENRAIGTTSARGSLGLPEHVQAETIEPTREPEPATIPLTEERAPEREARKAEPKLNDKAVDEALRAAGLTVADAEEYLTKNRKEWNADDRGAVVAWAPTARKSDDGGAL